jgi:hypothetical protein
MVRLRLAWHTAPLPLRDDPKRITVANLIELANDIHQGIRPAVTCVSYHPSDERRKADSRKYSHYLNSQFLDQLLISCAAPLNRY